MLTAYEIYQTYLKGPAALIRLFEQALGTGAIYGQPITDKGLRIYCGAHYEAIT